uniref:Major facilitator superfamily (MFS) profile domain-containing protein n=1 Tax=Chromera velia CCMP2878 TaxID=1169474 RepID=A0A0G4FX12_9ALVE|eukprot:Cvel_19156.t1-p1 / transcript=Cvel_19156.t1 / gene=Cvel_19156 / organism=Chromera_velia_CCMP2878 / gene_product=Protein spinster, putative / transcript_product=Protein spinster, putative / location=Cvel_scaffold1631:2921-7127(+) / protein_length=764 / sequence_SO=supercontig / SO=protein_coding / is_pseudo=false
MVLYARGGDPEEGRATISYPVSPQTQEKMYGVEDHSDPVSTDTHGTSQVLKTQAIVNATCALDGADAQLLPATFRALESQLGMRPSDMSLLSLAQSLCQSASSPVWGFCADRFSRGKFLAFGCFLWGGVTCLLALVSSFGQMLLLRAVNGIALASVSPISQSIIADMFAGSQRGRAFGWVQFFSSIGGMAGGILTTSLSEERFFGGTVEGWRLAFLFIGVSSLFLGFGVWVGAADVDRGRGRRGYKRVPANERPGLSERGGEETVKTARVEEGDAFGGEGKREEGENSPESFSSSPSVTQTSFEETRQSLPSTQRDEVPGCLRRGAASEGSSTGVPDRYISTDALRSGMQPEKQREGGKVQVPLSPSPAGELRPAAVGVESGGRGHSGSSSSFAVSFCRLCVSELSLLCGLMRTPSFAFIVLQGVFGAVPWNAMGFLTLFMQYCGLSDFLASVAASSLLAAGAFGGMTGGMLGDLLEGLLGDHGRPLVAQLSVALGIPVTVVMLHLVPRQSESAPLFICLMMVLGFVSTWTPAGTNRPILCEITSDDARARTFSWLVALEGSSAALFGAPLVAFFAETVFGYSLSEAKVSDMDEGARLANADALARALTLIMVLPWAVCFLLYGALHVTYPRDKRRHGNRNGNVDDREDPGQTREGGTGGQHPTMDHSPPPRHRSHTHRSPPPLTVSPCRDTEDSTHDGHQKTVIHASSSFSSSSYDDGSPTPTAGSEYEGEREGRQRPNPRKSPRSKRKEQTKQQPPPLLTVP